MTASTGVEVELEFDVLAVLVELVVVWLLVAVAALVPAVVALEPATATIPKLPMIRDAAAPATPRRIVRIRARRALRIWLIWV